MFHCYKATRLSESQPGYLNQKGWDRQTIRLRRLGLVALMMLFVVGLFLSRGIDAEGAIAQYCLVTSLQVATKPAWLTTSRRPARRFTTLLGGTETGRPDDHHRERKRKH